jgi:HKD family nuclease
MRRFGTASSYGALFALAGTAILATITGCGNSATPASTTTPPTQTSAVLTLSATVLNFPTTTIGQTSPAQTLTLTNTGNATLTLSTVTVSNTTDFADTTTCGSSLAAGASCSFSITFKPSTAAALQSIITVTDNAANSPQSVTLNGTGVTAATPAVTLSQTSVAFASQTAGTTSAATKVTLTNSGTATLSLSSIALGGTNPADFTESNNCPSTLAAGAYCTLSVAFAPQAATGYAATVFVTDNAGNVPNAQQGVSLSGTGASASSGGSNTYTLLTFPETDLSVTPLYALVNNAKTSIDMTMYALQDTTFSADLVAACNRGVKVRVILDASLEKSSNTAAYNQLNAVPNCSAAWSNTQFQATHQKSLLIDGSQLAVMSLNLQSQYYSTTRDFALLENDPADIAAVETTFLQDYQFTNATTDYNYQPPTGDDLIWSPTTAKAAMTNIIANAQSTLLIENEELASSASYIISALTTACSKGVIVHLTMVDQSSYEANFKTLEAAGCGVHVYPNTQTGFYVHAKAVVADYGLPSQSVYMGSINYSNASMTQNRELGLYITDPASVQSLATTMASDYAGASPY